MRPWIGIALALTACGDSSHPLTPTESATALAGANAFIKRINGGRLLSCNAEDFNSDGFVVCNATNAFEDDVRLRCHYRASDRIGCTQG